LSRRVFFDTATFLYALGELLQKALRLGGYRTKKATINEALKAP